MQQVARAVAEATDTVFGLMGNGNAALIRELADLGISLITVRHEAAAIAAADAFQRATGRLAVATTTYGPGFTNALTPLIDAALSRSPLLFLAGSDSGADHAALVAACGVRVEQDVAVAVEYALRESAPVVVFLPFRRPVPAADRGDVSRLLSDAEQPLILAGRGAVGRRTEVVALAQALGADVATTAPAKGFFQGVAGVRDLGICGGFSTPEARLEMRAADVVLVVGASLNRFTLMHSFRADAHVMQLDPHAPTSPRVDTVLEDLPEVRGCREARPAVRTTHHVGDGVCADGRLDPRSLFVRLNEVLPSERIVVTDGGHFIAWPCMYLDVPGPDHLVLVGTGFESIGLGFGSAVGVVEAAGSRLTVLVTGDGGGLMALADAESVIRRVHATGGRCVVVVVNDAAYGAEVHQYAWQGVPEEPMLIPEVDFTAVLGAFGAQGAVVRTLDDVAVIEDWLASGESGTWVLDCRVSRSVVAPFLARK
ncbi:MAG: thiamine pyrophosphate-binding protein [Corynebacterium sp.]|uniref:thiamine pyrophosphate-binding protein n=1 Tax=Corynebacterium sp. TaxID=1720 RepID=UPI0026E0755D|nr:thiamine pyrophosphate-binding protein [Corynebacterium sp.]MDO5669734.1 thiamine pyrophosphate-binding protein [Corynebacterium sp.]